MLVISCKIAIIGYNNYRRFWLGLLNPTYENCNDDACDAYAKWINGQAFKFNSSYLDAVTLQIHEEHGLSKLSSIDDFQRNQRRRVSHIRGEVGVPEPPQQQVSK